MSPEMRDDNAERPGSGHSGDDRRSARANPVYPQKRSIFRRVLRTGGAGRVCDGQRAAVELEETLSTEHRIPLRSLTSEADSTFNSRQTYVFKYYLSDTITPYLCIHQAGCRQLSRSSVPGVKIPAPLQLDYLIVNP